MTGEGVKKDPVQAHVWLTLAAANGVEQARMDLNQLEKEMTPEQKVQATKLTRDLSGKLKKKE